MEGGNCIIEFMFWSIEKETLFIIHSFLYDYLRLSMLLFLNFHFHKAHHIIAFKTLVLKSKSYRKFVKGFARN